MRPIELPMELQIAVSLRSAFVSDVTLTQIIGWSQMVFRRNIVLAEKTVKEM